jgi:hypothetical protein
MVDKSMKPNIGIYFLWAYGECVYVGKSTDIKSRIYKHRGNYAFDKYTIMECSEWELDAFESRFINAMKPKHNSMMPQRKEFPQLSRPMHARFATLDELIQSMLPNWISPVPSRETLRAWFDASRVPRTKSNPLAKRGGGPVFYSVDAVEKIFKNRVLPGPIALIRK